MHGKCGTNESGRSLGSVSYSYSLQWNTCSAESFSELSPSTRPENNVCPGMLFLQVSEGDSARERVSGRERVKERTGARVKEGAI